MRFRRCNPIFGCPLGLFVVGVLYFDRQYAIFLICIAILMTIGLLLNERKFNREYDRRIEQFLENQRDIYATPNQNTGELVSKFLTADNNQLHQAVSNTNEQHTIRLFVKPYDESNEDTIKCGICYNDVIESDIVLYHSTCGEGHTMCGECLKKLLFQQSDSNGSGERICVKYRCPYCREYNIIYETNGNV